MGAFLTLVDHKAPSYVHKSATSGPVVRLLVCFQCTFDLSFMALQNYLEKHPSWGLTSEVKGDKAKYEVIKGRARYQLTKFRNLIKDAVSHNQSCLYCAYNLHLRLKTRWVMLVIQPMWCQEDPPARMRRISSSFVSVYLPWEPRLPLMSSYQRSWLAAWRMW